MPLVELEQLSKLDTILGSVRRQGVYIADVSSDEDNGESDYSNKDGQWLNTNIDVKYKINKEKAMTVFSNYTSLENINHNVISPAVQRAIESVTSPATISMILGMARKFTKRSTRL